jgi:hypothetical protein
MWTSLKRKLNILVAEYQWERRKVADAKKSASGADDIKVPKWYVS